jgi:hypothetical protein
MMESRIYVLRGTIMPIQFKRGLSICVLLGALTMTSRAGIIDPQMAVESAGDPLPFNGGVAFGADADGGGVFQYYNNTGATIIAITFGAFVATGLGTPDNPALPPLACNSGDDVTAPNPFFTSCMPTYDPTTGELDFQFFGLSSPEGGTDKGIPPILPGCTYLPDTPPSEGCTVGTFSVSLNFNFSLSGDSGGWGTLGDPTFTATSVQTNASTPEPGPGFMVGIALMAGALLVAFRRFKQPRLSEIS